MISPSTLIDLIDRAGRLLGHVVTDSGSTTTVTGTVDTNVAKVAGAAPSATNPFWSRLTDGVAAIGSVVQNSLRSLLVATQQNTFISILNSTTANINAGNTWSGSSEALAGYGSFVVNSKSDQPTTLDVYQSSNGTDWDIHDTFPIGGNNAATYTFQVVASYYKVTLTNPGGTNTTYVRLQTVLLPTSNPLPRSLSANGNLGVFVAEGSMSVVAQQGVQASNSRAWPVRVSDGTNVAAVKAASTAAVAADPSVVVALSPNSPIPTGTNSIGGTTNAASSQADGHSVTIGALADAAWVSGNGSVISLLKGIFGRILPKGQTTMANSGPVVIASDQSPIPVQARNDAFDLSGTSPSSAGTSAGATQTGLGIYRTMMVFATFQGATGGALDVYLQFSPDQGTTWVDWVHFTQIAAGASPANFALTLSKSTQNTGIQTGIGTGLSPALGAGKIIGGDWGDRIRVVWVAGAGTSAGAAQTIKITCTS